MSAAQSARSLAALGMAWQRSRAHAVTSGCDFWYNTVPSPDDLWHVIPWFDHMITRQSCIPTRAPTCRATRPTGTVPVTGGEADWSAEWTTGKAAAADTLKNPYAAGAGEGQGAAAPGPDVPVIPRDVDAAGDTLFQTYCAVCHGHGGRREGTGLARGSARRRCSPRRPGRTATATSTASSATAAASCRATATRSTCPATAGRS